MATAPRQTGRFEIAVMILALWIAPVLLSQGAWAQSSGDLPPIRFTLQPKIKLAVRSVQIRSEYIAPAEPPFVDHKARVRPVGVMRRWGEQRLQATPSASQDEAVFIVREASIVRRELETKGGLSGLFTKEEAERFDLVLEGHMVIYDGNGNRVGFASTVTTRYQTVLEDADEDNRQRTWYDMTKKGMDQFNRQMEAAIRKHLSQWVVR